MQKRVALSTAEAEYRAATLATKDVVWLRRLLKELGMEQTRPTKIYEDNQACIKMIENPIISERNKHVELDAHYIREQYLLKQIVPVKVGTTEHVADLLTKNLPGPAFQRHTRRLLLTASTPHEAGHGFEGDC